MAKLFKTISLEERYKNSDQGQRLPIPTTIKAKESASLKIAPNAVEKNSAILKAVIKKPLPQTDSLREFITTPLSSLAKPIANTKFRSAISLRDRLSQSKLGTTTYLPQFFLSDTYADYIKINPFGLFTHTSNTQITYPNAIGNQGSTTVGPHNPQIAQGSINLQVLNYDSLVLQGTFFSNGAYSSFINTNVPIQNPNQGSGTNPKYAKASDLIAPLQGLGTNPQPSKKVETLALLQGIIVSNSKTQSVISTVLAAPEGAYPVIPLTEITPTKPAGTYTEDPKIKIKLTPKEVSVFVPTNIVINPTAEEVQQDIPNDASNILPFNFRPKFTSPTLKLLRYELSRTIAFFSPIVAHGDSGLSATVTKEGSEYFQKSLNTVLQNRDNNALIDAGKDYNLGKGAIIDYLNSIKVVDTIELDSKASVDYKKVGIYTSSSVDLEQQKTVVDTKSPGLDDSSGPSRSLGNYSTLTYDQLKTKAESQQDLINQDFRETLQISRTWVYKGNKTVKYINNQPPSKFINEGKTTEILSSPTSTAGINDFVKLEIGVVVGGGKRAPFTFKAFLTSFSDSFTTAYGSKMMFGRTQEIKTFEKGGRQISLGFKVAAFTKADLNIIYGRLQTICQVATVPGIIKDVPAGSNTFDLTVGAWCVKVPILIESIKVDVQTTEYSWDLDRGLPHLVDVSLSCTVDAAQGRQYLAIINQG